MAMRIQRAERRQAGDIGGAFGDLGVLLPYVVGAVTVAGLAPAGILLGFGLFLVASGLFYALPMAVQPMKVVGAMLLTGELDAAAVAATGLVMGVVLLTLAATGAIGRLARLIPSSVGAGLQLGIGLAMALFGFTLMDGALWFGVLVLFVLFGLMRVPRCPAAPLTILLAIACGVAIGDVAMPDWPAGGLALPGFALPEPASFWPALENAVLPQLPLTLTNAVIVTAALAHSLYPERAARATPRNLLLTTGLANLVLAPFGALPMCHGAGGVQAQHRFGARTGSAPILLGILLIAAALFQADAALALFAMVPPAAMGALLIVAGADLALSRRLFDVRPDCWPAIALTAGLAAFVDPALALAVGWALETLRGPVLRRLRARFQRG
jgi:predicted benzoate:H+ symporter BenE